MFKFARIATAAILLATTCIAHAGEAEIRKALAETAPGVEVVSVTKLPYAGLYQVVTKGFNIFYTDENGRIGIFGNMVDLKSRENLTKAEKDKISVVDFASLPLDKAIVRVKGNGKRTLVLFSDPECPYCQALEKQLQSVTDVTIYTFLLPLPTIHPGAMRAAELIWCAKDRAQAWDDMLLKQQEPKDSNTTCDTPIKQIAEIADKDSITGTPGIVFTNGKLLLGNQPSELINKMLDDAMPKFDTTPRS